MTSWLKPIAALPANRLAQYRLSAALPPEFKAGTPASFLPPDLMAAREADLTHEPHQNRGQHNLRKAFTPAK